MRAFLIAVAAFAIASCATTTDSGGSGEVRSITMEDEPCFGFCPVYRITLTPGDAYVLDGQRHTATQGISEGQLQTGAFAAAVQALETANFRSLPEDLTYNNPAACPGPQISDMPHTRVTVEYSNGTHSVHHYHGCSSPDMRGLRETLRGLVEYDTRIRPQN
ncbi:MULTISPECIES: DUF6438 domain-containing protein [Hyphobacterium]|uniref:DUF6438 domain-containing protein n=1 Tax=Hyphobacterium vulgare TaxID=1736751 RepID=A0ABV6ZXE3_9PROT